jgi:DNA-binding CsgD family transcriptional regulator
MKVWIIISSFIFIGQSPGYQGKVDSLTLIASQTTVDTVKIDALYEIAKIFYGQNSKDFDVFAGELLVLAEEVNYSRGIARILYLTGLYLHREGKFIEALQLMKRLQEIGSQPGLTFYKGQALALTGIIHKERGRLNQGLEYLEEAAKIYKAIDDKNRLINVMNATAGIYTDLAKIHSNDSNYLEIGYMKLMEVNSMAKELGHLTMIANSNALLGDIFRMKKNFAKSISLYKEAWFIADSIGNKNMSTDIWGVIGFSFYESGQIDSARIYLTQAIAASRMYNYEPLSIKYSIELGRTYISTGDYAVAQNILTQTEKQARSLGFWNYLNDIIKMKVEIFSQLKDFENGLSAMSELDIVTDTLNMIASRDKIALLESSYELDNAELKLAQMEEEKEYQAKIKKIVIGGSIPLAALVIITIVLLWRWNLGKKKMLATQQNLHHLEISNLQLQEKNLKMNLELKNKELAAQALNLVTKENLLKDIRESVTQLNDGVQSPAAIHAILKQIELSQNRDKDWNEFKLYFEQVHVDFFKELNSRIGDLSPSEIKLSALLRLNLSIKQCADILGISPESVKMARHRLRKKLQLQTEDNLITFLMTLN